MPEHLTGSSVPPGKLITFEGIEGVGKSTNQQYVAQILDTFKIPYLLTREPGGTPVAEALRQILLAKTDEHITPKTELLIFYAARHQHVENKIKPALLAGKWVLCDRFFDATFAYQGGGRQMPLEQIEQLHQWTLDDFCPDHTLLFDAPVDVSLERIAQRGALDRFEQEQAAFFERIRQHYLMRAQKEPSRFSVIQAQAPLTQVQSQLDHILQGWLTHE